MIVSGFSAAAAASAERLSAVRGDVSGGVSTGGGGTTTSGGVGGFGVSLKTAYGLAEISSLQRFSKCTASSEALLQTGEP